MKFKILFFVVKWVFKHWNLEIDVKPYEKYGAIESIKITAEYPWDKYDK